MKSLALLSMLTAPLLWVELTLAGQSGLLVALVVAVALNFGVCWFPDRFVLRMHRARELDAGDAPGLAFVLRGLAKQEGKQWTDLPRRSGFDLSARLGLITNRGSPCYFAWFTTR